MRSPQLGSPGSRPQEAPLPQDRQRNSRSRCCLNANTRRLEMSRGFPSMTALMGLLAVAGFQNRDKIAEMLRGAGSGNPGTSSQGDHQAGLGGLLGSLGGGSFGTSGQGAQLGGLLGSLGAGGLGG